MEIKEERLSRAISAYSRREILRLLADRELPVKDIAKRTNMSVSLASRHLKMLYDLGFLQVRIQPPNKYYSVKVKRLNKLLEIYDEVLKAL
jgi:DNA-binding transcriptional ArsR family regulator